jgi:hypothetical protein
MADPTLTAATVTFQPTMMLTLCVAGRSIAPQERRTIESLPRHKRTMIAIRAPV